MAGGVAGRAPSRAPAPSASIGRETRELEEATSGGRKAAGGRVSRAGLGIGTRSAGAAAAQPIRPPTLPNSSKRHGCSPMALTTHGLRGGGGALHRARRAHHHRVEAAKHVVDAAL